MLRLLLTNDDGIAAPGLLALAARLGHVAEVTIVAPDNPRSASSHSITLHKPLRLIERNDIAAATGGCRALECSGTPADCITLGLQHVCRQAPPHLVLSGINDGPNLGEDLIYSGTVAGALEGAIHGVPGLALSLAGLSSTSFAEAAELAELLIACLLYGGFLPAQADLASALNRRHPAGYASWRLPPGVIPAEGEAARWPAPGNWHPGGIVRLPCFNVNFPDRPLAAVEGLRWTGLGHREYHDVVEEHADPRGRPLYWIWGQRVVPDQPLDSDIRAVEEGCISVTPIRGDLLNRSDLPVYSLLFSATPAEPGES